MCRIGSRPVRHGSNALADEMTLRNILLCGEAVALPIRLWLAKR